MSFFITQSNNEHIKLPLLLSIVQIDLPAGEPVTVFPLCVGNIHHKLIIEFDMGGSTVILMRTPGVFLEKNLIVDCGPIESGGVVTTVFNYSNRAVRINRGDIISRLISVRLA